MKLLQKRNKYLHKSTGTDCMWDSQSANKQLTFSFNYKNKKGTTKFMKVIIIPKEMVTRTSY